MFPSTATWFRDLCRFLTFLLCFQTVQSAALGARAEFSAPTPVSAAARPSARWSHTQEPATPPIAQPSAVPSFELAQNRLGAATMQVASASSSPSYDQCIYALNQTAAKGLYINGAAVINAANCGVVVDSSSSTALSFSGSGTFTAKYFDVVGGYSTSGAARFSPTPQTQSAYQPDPLSFLVPPSSSACNYTNFKVTTGSSTLNPGTYCNGIAISGATIVTFNPGMYILMGGGLSVTQASILKGTGVTFFLTQGLGYKYGPLTVSGASIATLSAPTSGAYKGILFYQDPSIGTGQPANTESGSQASTLTGVLYFPTTALTYAGAAVGNNCLIVIADTITLTGSAAFQSSCSGGSPLQPPVSVSVSPASATLYANKTQQFTATVTNTSNTAVTWTASVGTISASGLYTAPASITTQQTATIAATSQADNTKKATATVTLMPPVSVTPATATLYGGQTKQFTSNQAVNWTASAGTISATGLYTAPATVASQQNVTITATSQASGSQTGTATVTLMPPVSVTPATATLYGGGTQQFASNQAVNWTASAGTISATGLYTAPATVASKQTVRITATSQTSGTQSGTATVTLMPPVSVTPATATLYGGQTQPFTANQAVNWTASAGTISPSGLYTAPATITAQQNVTITATSQVNGSQTGTATVTLMPSVTVSPATATLYGGQTLQFTSNQAVNWTASAGMIDATGLYTAPATITAQQTVTITATSQTSGTQTGTATVTLMPPVSVSPATATLYVGQTQQFTSNQPVTWSSSPTGAGSIDPATGLYTAPAAIAAPQQVTVTATSQADQTKSASATVSLSPPISFAALRINAGGPTYVDPAGRVWMADTDFSSPCSEGGTGSFTPPAGLDGEYATYRTCYWTRPDITYQIPVPNMDYLVTLKFAEPNLSAGQRVFSVAVNGQTNSVLSAVDVAANAGGPQKAWDTTIPISVTNGQITIAFSAINGGPIINAIEVVPANTLEVVPQTATLGERQRVRFTALEPGVNNPAVNWSITPANLGSIDSTGLYAAPASIPAATTVTITAASATNPNIRGTAVVSLSPTDPTSFAALRINSGGPTYVDPAGRVWVADTDFTSPCSEGGTGSFTPPAGLDGEYGTYRTCYWSRPDITYQIPVPNMEYLVTLKFAEPNLSAGQRVFSVAVNGQTNSVLSAVDVAANAGGPQKAWDTTIPISVANGQITIAFSSINGGPIINAIEIRAPGAVSVAPSTARLHANQTEQFVATVDDPTNPGVQWTITPPNAGAISASGLYSAPPVVTVQQTVTVTATNLADSNLTATATVTLLPPIAVTVAPSAETLSAGQSQTFTATVWYAGNPAVTWTIGPSVGEMTATGLYTAPATIAAQQTVAVTATSVEDPTKSGSATVTLSPAEVVSGLTLAPPVAGPNVTGATQTLDATLKTPSGTPVGGAAILFTVSGPNATSGSGTTNASGVASFTYTGANSGTDTVQASSGGTVSNTANVSWLKPVQSISTSSIFGQFFVSDGSGGFDTSPTAKPVFTQWFPTINFNPPAGTVPGNTSSVDVNTRPFTDITTDLNGNFTGAIAAQGNGYQAGVGPLVTFQAVFTGSYTAAGPGNVTFNFYTDDGFMMGIGGGATRVSGTLVNAPAATPFLQYPVLGALNTGTPPVGSQFTVYFPAAGSYPYEIDYSECCGGQLVLTMTSGAANQTGIPPSGGLTLTPNTVATTPAGQSLTFTVLATDASGATVPNAPVAFTVTGANYLELSGVTGANGQVAFTYTGANSGTDLVQALGTVSGMFAMSNQVTVPWGTPSPTPPATPPPGLNLSVSGASQLTLPSPAIYTATATDPGLPSGSTIAISWTQVSGPATVQIESPQQAVTTVTFPAPGVYALQCTATDSLGSQVLAVGPITVNPPEAASLSQGWLAGLPNQTLVTGQLPITLIPGVTLASGTLVYYQATSINGITVLDPNSMTVLNANTTGSGTLATLDTTLLPNGSYYILLQATDTTGKTQGSGMDIVVGGDYKPGRVTATVTDLVVPAPGLPIQIQRTYDSLVRGKSSDFGYGWTLGVNVQLEVSPSNDVTLTLNGQRRTFYFTPYVPGFEFSSGLFIPNLLGVYFAAYTPEPGMFGSLTATNTGCVLDWMVKAGNMYFCYANAGNYSPELYTYTDPYGRVYTIAANGGLQSIKDLAGNTITVTPNGIMASNGLSVPFVRDAQGRVTQITDTLGHDYLYAYDANGDLASVTYSGVATPAQYQYDATHLYTGGTDQRGNPLPTAVYDANGRLISATDALNQTTSYAYDLTTNTTTVTFPDTGVQTTKYDAYGKVLSTTDPLNHTTTNVYDSNHNLISVTDPLGHTTSYTYDSNGNRTSVTNPLNKTRSTAYNAYSEPTQTTDELSNVRNFAYDANFWPHSLTDTIGTLASFNFNANGTRQAQAIGYDLSASPGNATTYTYDTYGNLISKTDPLGRQTQYTYDNLGRQLTMTTPAGGTTTNQYDALGNLKQVTAPLGRVTSSAYDGNGNKISDTDANGHTTTYQYDALNRLSTTTYPTPPPNNTSTLTYDFRNNVVNATDQAGNVTHNDYDLAGRLIATTKAYGTASASRTTYTYYADHRRQTQTDPAGNTTTYTYDAAGRLVTVTDAANNQTHYDYDDAGNQTSITDAKGHATQFQYDCRKRPIKATYPDSTSTTNTYDGPGNLTGVTDQAGNTVQYTYDVANQLKSVIQANHPDPAHNTTAYGYDNNGNLTASTDANGHSTATVFDVLNELISTTLPDGALTETRAYDPAGNLLTLGNLSSKTTTYACDPLNRLLSKTPDPSLGETAESFTYTATGKRATMTHASGLTTYYVYDNLDRLTSKTTPQGALGYTHDAAGNVASMTSSNPNGISVAYTYDQLNRLATVADNRLAAGQNTTTYTYDPASNLATATYPNGQQSTFTYDDLNRLRALNGYSYQLGPTGNRQSATEPSGRTANWSYDGIYRLTNEAISLDPHGKNGAVGYGLDPAGNRLSETSTLPGIPSATFAYDADDRILSTEQYDNNGNTTVSGARTFAYDFENRLKSMNNGAVTLVYDGDGNRVVKTASGATTQYLVDDLNPTGYAQVVEELLNGAVQRRYTYALQRISQTQFLNSAWATSFYGYDGFGSVRQLTDPKGAVTDTYDYDAWGNILNQTGSTPNVYLYRGEQFDPDLSLYYLRARYLNPLTGRFLTRDPAQGSVDVPETLHRYLYVGANPIRFMDPTGYNEVEKSLLADLPIAFGHGARHLIGTGLSQAEVEALIEQAVREIAASGNWAGGPFIGWLEFPNGITIFYRVWLVTSAVLRIAIGTYTVGP
jgi:RHS repeat-associated protein